MMAIIKRGNCQSVMTQKYRKPVTEVLSSVGDGRFVSDMLLEALSRHPEPAYLHSDMGSEYTSSVFEN
ncbi:Transposase InsO and inactivated derivatives (Tra5) [Fructobacillus tropaeoli]|uniref:Transposase InsO and inactivated derivatives (Tra5) n=1 Tax=Fructobacillus tropaeoli TaxID=709323 RepID=A0ABM9MYN3_9LACO|nr:Transposase InsO and inactivated derivatives (Tra5) [Fructobacillus tropaeoli]CAK1249696.1 Transposase InsO and inactivated derivatives (Tra5) [Fructobacillus tropaeoli]